MEDFLSAFELAESFAKIGRVAAEIDSDRFDYAYDLRFLLIKKPVEDAKSYKEILEPLRFDF